MSIAARRSTETITLFSWGYYGWGNYTKQMVDAVDAVEDSRRPHGFMPPLFVDIRIHRKVRATGFREAALGKLLGDRYQYMQGLGNKAVQTREGRLRIANPEDAAKLLDLALRDSRRRVIFFCGCEFPKADGETACHRDEVADLVLKAAPKGVSVEIVEWPGGEPQTADLDVSPDVFKSLVRGRTTVPLDGSALPPPLFCGLSWGSIVTVRSGSESMRVISGPARCRIRKKYQTDEWSLPAYWYFFDSDTALSEIEQKAEELREALGLNSRPIAKHKGKKESRTDFSKMATVHPALEQLDVLQRGESSSDLDYSKMATAREEGVSQKSWYKHLKEQADNFIGDHYDYHAKLGVKADDQTLNEIANCMDEYGRDDLKKFAMHLGVDDSGGWHDLKSAILKHVGNAHDSADPEHIRYRSEVDASVAVGRGLIEKAKAGKAGPKEIKAYISDLKKRDARFAELVGYKLGAHGKTEDDESAARSARAVKALMERTCL